jgi:ribose 5-phosphate isomerase B
MPFSGLMNAKIFIGSDHRGFELKNKVKDYLEGRGFDVVDVGPLKYNKDDDFIDYAKKVSKNVLRDKGRGILICGSGQGMSVTANKIKGIRAVLCWNEESAKRAKEHMNANVICFGSDFVGENEADRIVRSWLNSEFQRKKRYVRRTETLAKM